MSLKHLVAFVSMWAAAHAVPAPEPTPAPAAGGAITSGNQLSAALSALSNGAQSAFAGGYTSLLSAVSPTSTPTNAAQAAAVASAAYSSYSNNPLGAAAEILLSGLAGGNFGQDIEGYGACNSANNSNYAYAYPPVYPKKGPTDAPYDIPELNLRDALYIPNTFQYGAKTPVIFVPGTGVEACEDFTPNLGKLFTGVSYADPVYLNVPNNMLMDLQVSAEYVAYAINYISRVSRNRQVAVVTWSAGSIATQWALKYWPSTQSATADVINISADYHGTILVPVLCPPGFPCAPSVIQQNYNSTFIQTLRNNGGDSAYVPTTSVWTIFDEIVEPQQTPPGASAMINDARNVGVTNAQIQNICIPGTPAGGPNFGHENTLYNAVAFALAKDALQNPGPGSVSRSGAASMCALFEAPGLDLEDIFATEALIPLAGYNIETYPNKVVVEPPIKPYAAADAPH